MTIAGALLKISMPFVVAAVASQSPSAIVEDLDGKISGILLMDYLTPGQVIKLGPKDTIVISYLVSCRHETITGGTVTIGTDQSDVVGGQVVRSTPPCGGGNIALTAQIADKSAATAFRQLPQGVHRDLQPQITLYGRSPVVELKPIGALVIERVDIPGERHDVILGDAHLVHGKFLDLAANGVMLAPGGVYTARIGTQQIVFLIDREAQAGWTPLAGRLLRLQPN